MAYELCMSIILYETGGKHAAGRTLSCSFFFCEPYENLSMYTVYKWIQATQFSYSLSLSLSLSHTHTHTNTHAAHVDSLVLSHCHNIPLSTELHEIEYKPYNITTLAPSPSPSPAVHEPDIRSKTNYMPELWHQCAKRNNAYTVLYCTLWSHAATLIQPHASLPSFAVYLSARTPYWP